MIALLFILGGVAIILGAAWWFARVRGGLSSLAGFIFLALFALGCYVVLMGLGVVPLPATAT